MSLAPYILVHLLFLSQLDLHSATEFVPKRDCQFSCGRLGMEGPPFSNTTNPNCGVFLLNCTEAEPTVQFQEKGKWYAINYINYSIKRIEIRDQEVQNHLVSNRCDLLQNFTDQMHFKSLSKKFYPIFSINITETRPIFKCLCRPICQSQFFNRFHNYTRCKDSVLYYYDDENKKLPSLPQDLSNSCSVVELPSSTHPDFININFTPHWAGNYIVEWNVLPECEKCYEEGGKCQIKENKNFQCTKLKGTNNKWKLLIALGTSLGLGCIVALLVFVYRNSEWNVDHESEMEQTINIGFEAFMEDQASLAPKRYNYQQIRTMTKSFENLLGQGGYGSVYKGTLSDGKLVAVKVLSTTKGNGEEFINEVASISRTSHVNIVSLLGYCFDGVRRALIYEYMPNGSLEKYIYEKELSEEHSKLGWGTLYRIAVGIAQGLQYLHRGCNTRILHFDIKPHNILLDRDFCPKISDFGLAKLCPGKETIISMVGGRGTAGYIAPEVFCRNFGSVSHKSDVYSYGMMILEMVGGRKNIDVGVDHTSEIYFPHWIYKRIELNENLGLHGVVSEVQVEEARKMILVGLWCIQTNPLDRPSMSRVLEMLEGGVEVLEIPPKPYLSSPPRVQEDSSIS